MKKKFHSFKELGAIVNHSQPEQPAPTMKNTDNLVYSTEVGGKIDRKKLNASAKIPNATNIRVSKVKKGRGGKTVTLIQGLNFSVEELKCFRQMLQKKIKTGGTVKEHCIELQGEHREIVLKILEKKGLFTKISNTHS